MAWSLVAQDNWGVTARLAVDFRRPVPVGRPIRAEGWVVRARRRLVDTAGHIVDASGTVLASAEAVYLAADKPQARAPGPLRLPDPGRPGRCATPPSEPTVAETPEPVDGR